MSGSFSDAGDLPAPRSGHVASGVDGKMLIWGGFGEVQDQFSTEKYAPCDVLWIYDFEKKTWSRHQTSDTAMLCRSGSCCFTHLGKLYIWGGFPHHSKELFCLDLATGIWQDTEAAGDIPHFRDKFVCWVYCGRMIMFGGFGPMDADATNGSWVADPGSFSDWDQFQMRGWNNDTFEYSIEHNRWRKLTTLGQAPCPRASHAGAVVGNRGFLFGGRFQSTRRNDMHYLDLDTHTWSGSLPIHGPIPEGRSWHSLTVVGPSHLLLCGGFSTNSTPLDDIWLFDTENFVWTRIEYSLPAPRLWHTAVPGLSLGEVVLFGGCTNNILSPDDYVSHSNTALHVVVTAKPLLRLCLEFMRRNIDVFRGQINQLPDSLRPRVLIVDNPS